MAIPRAQQEQLRIEVRERSRRGSREAAARQGPEAARRDVLRLLDEQLRRLPAAERSPVACRAGCSMCCHLRVMATPAEVYGLLDYLAGTLSPQAFAEFRERVAAARARIMALPAAEVLTTNLACPLLVDGHCSGYAARPLNCRSYHSLDLAACQRAFERPTDTSLGHPQYAAVARVHEGLQGGFIEGQAESGYDSAQHELVTALDEALSDPEARSRFLAGKQAFRTPSPV
jgi:hypothetical protein